VYEYAINPITNPNPVYSHTQSLHNDIIENKNLIETGLVAYQNEHGDAEVLAGQVHPYVLLLWPNEMKLNACLANSNKEAGMVH
jgi:hypothetical protein